MPNIMKPKRGLKAVGASGADLEALDPVPNSRGVRAFV
jgi:hypothetical protein